MKVLIALSVVQIAAIVFLAGRIVALERLAEATTVDRVAAGETQALEPTRESHSPQVSAPRDYPNQGQIRRIVREELAAQLGALSWPGTEAGGVAEVDDPGADAEREQQLEWVNQEIDRYVAIGEISDVEMVSLQSEIAKLDKEGQRRMLSRLVRAMNAGELEGRL